VRRQRQDCNRHGLSSAARVHERKGENGRDRIVKLIGGHLPLGGQHPTESGRGSDPVRVADVMLRFFAKSTRTS
jgi:hypothetical protein